MAGDPGREVAERGATRMDVHYRTGAIRIAKREVSATTDLNNPGDRYVFNWRRQPPRRLVLDGAGPESDRRRRPAGPDRSGRDTRRPVDATRFGLAARPAHSKGHRNHPRDASSSRRRASAKAPGRRQADTEASAPTCPSPRQPRPASPRAEADRPDRSARRARPLAPPGSARRHFEDRGSPSRPPAASDRRRSPHLSTAPCGSSEPPDVSGSARNVAMPNEHSLPSR